MGKKENLIPSLVLTEDHLAIPKRGGKYVSKSAASAEIKERLERVERLYNSCNCNCDCNCDYDREEVDCCNY